jgi:hypothetical protein
MRKAHFLSIEVRNHIAARGGALTISVQEMLVG